MAAVRHLDFEILKFLLDRQIGRPNMHRCTKFHQNWSNGCWDIAFNVFLNGGRPPSWIFKGLIFEQLQVIFGRLMCAIVQNFVKIGQIVSEISWFFDFQDGHRPPSSIMKFWHIWFPVRLKRLRCIMVPNFTKIGRMAADISHLTFFYQNGRPPPSRFFKFIFGQFLGFGGPMCVRNRLNRC